MDPRRPRGIRVRTDLHAAINMAAKLPEELLKEILSISLHVSEHDFADTGPTSPFRLITRSGSYLLVVSKRWMRVATPELYRTVILRSIAQAKRLSLALKSNPGLGSHVRQLRIEGAYGDALRHIAARCSFVTDICISLRVWSHDNASGLVVALTQLAPTRVVLTLAPEKLPSNRQHDELLQALCKHIKTWNSLVCLEKLTGCSLTYLNSSLRGCSSLQVRTYADQMDLSGPISLSIARS